MPTPDRTSVSAIVAAGCDLLDAGGLDAVTMAAVAARVGVRAPSLYKRVRSRDALIRLIAEDAAVDLAARLAFADRGLGDPSARLQELLRALRAFAQSRPSAYRLVFAPGTEMMLSQDLLETTSAPLFAVVSELVSPAHALEAARTVTAWATGFLTMELAGAFRLGGDVEAAFEYGVTRLAAAMAAG